MLLPSSVSVVVSQSPNSAKTIIMANLEEDYKLTWVEQLAAGVLKMGPLPRHVAIILDGNRRFARKNNLGHVSEGHKRGADKTDQVIDMLIALGVKELTVYAFSTENFKRSQAEVDGIMELLKKRANFTVEKREKWKAKGILGDYIGNLNLVPTAELGVIIKKNLVDSRDAQCNQFKLNIAFIYTGRNEIAKGVNTLLRGLNKGQLETAALSEELLRETFTLHPSHPVDILIRTSGECRLSDFLLWGCSEAYMEFVDVTWPEFTFWLLAKIIFRYQNHVLYRKKGFMDTKKKKASGEMECAAGGREFINLVREEKWKEFEASIKAVEP